MAHPLHATWVKAGMLVCRHWHGLRADRAEVPLKSLVPLAVQPLVLQLGRALLAGLLVDLAVGLLATHAAVFDEEAGRAVLELDTVATLLSAVGAHISGCCRRDATRRHGSMVANLPVMGMAGWPKRRGVIV